MFLLKKKYQIANIYNSIFKENFKKKLNFDWVKYPERHDIIKKIIEKKNIVVIWKLVVLKTKPLIK